MKIDALKRLGACCEAIKWAASQPNAATAWRNCERGDWMLWLLARTTCAKRGSPNHRKLVLLCCQIARTTLKYVPKGDSRPISAIRLAERWARDPNSVTDDELRAAAAAAAGAALVAAAAWAGAAVRVAAWAAAAARVAGGWKAEGAAQGAAQAAAYRKFASMVRKAFPKPPREVKP